MGNITSDNCEMLNIAICMGITPSRWTKAISVMLEKDVGQPNINRLRVIHLFKADYNLFLKTLWAKRMVEAAEDAQVLGSAQHGSRPCRTALDAGLLERLTFDLSKTLWTNLGVFDNDAKSCYDRIINGLAMIAARRLGMPSWPIATHAGVLQAMQYTVKTKYGVSDRYITSLSHAILVGTGQGSGASPAVWLSISVVLLASLQVLAKRGMYFQNPSGQLTLERWSDAFVDDTQNGINDAFITQPWSLEDLIRNLENTSQMWERLLCSRDTT